MPNLISDVMQLAEIIFRNARWERYATCTPTNTERANAYR